MDAAYQMTEIFLISFTFVSFSLCLHVPDLFSGSVSVRIIHCMQTVAESALVPSDKQTRGQTVKELKEPLVSFAIAVQPT